MFRISDAVGIYSIVNKCEGHSSNVKLILNPVELGKCINLQLEKEAVNLKGPDSGKFLIFHYIENKSLRHFV